MIMPRTLGFIDGTLVRIVPPPKHLHREAYYCRKGFTALNVQIVCDASMYIMNVNARYPGACNDPFIYRHSPVRPAMMAAYRENPCWLLGDSAYPHEPWLQLPINEAPEGTPEYYYTKLHCLCRCLVERCIGLLKARWRCLLNDRTLHYLPEKAGRIVNSCVLLDYFCHRFRVRDPRPIFENQGEVDPENDDDEEVLRLLHEADHVRNYLINFAHERHQNLHVDD